MELDLGYLVAFILTAFSTISTITTIFPSLTQTSENKNSDTYKFQALYALLNPHNSIASKLSANVTLHQVPDAKDANNQTIKYGNSRDPKVLLPLAAINYDINNTSKAEKLAESAQKLCYSKNSDCLKVWYLLRLLDINKANNVYLYPNNKVKVVHEDRNCNTTNWDCTQKELVDINNNISSLSQSRYDLQFYNDKSPVNFLEQPLSAFVESLHSFIIISFIIVFIVVIRKRAIIRRIFPKEVESK